MIFKILPAYSLCCVLDLSCTNGCKSHSYLNNALIARYILSMYFKTKVITFRRIHANVRNKLARKTRFISFVNLLFRKFRHVMFDHSINDTVWKHTKGISFIWRICTLTTRSIRGTCIEHYLYTITGTYILG